MAPEEALPMHGLMMNMPLAIPSLIAHADRWHPHTEVVSRLPEGTIHRYGWRDAHTRARRLARGLAAVGVQPGDRVATLAWNTHRHLELYYAVSGSGAICHTVNPRLFPDQVEWILNDAADVCVFFDLQFLKLVETLAPRCPGVRAWVAMTDREHMPATSLELACYEEIITAHDDQFAWPAIEETHASSLCYTSGTTGNPKGAL